MTLVLSGLLLLPGLVLAIWAILLILQGFASLLPEPRRNQAQAAPTALRQPRYVVLMPAHNESEIIGATVQATLGHLGGNGQLLVVADNCSDDTAERAREAGAMVTERQHATERGKGFALAHGLKQLISDPPDVVVILDADCTAEPQALPAIVARAALLQRPVQARYDMLPPPGAGRKQRMAAFAWDFRVRLRAEGFRRLGLPCQLMGSGMAFPWSLLQRVDLANGHLVEDLKLGLDLARLQAPPILCPSAVVSSQFPLNEQGSRSQRQRWEHGHLSMVFSNGPGLLWEALLRRNAALLALTLDMSVPPLAFLVMVATGYAALVATLVQLGWAAPWLLIAGPGALALIGISVLLGWWRVGRRWISAGELCMTPVYVLGKIPVYLAFLTRKQLDWVRTRRD